MKFDIIYFVAVTLIAATFILSAASTFKRWASTVGMMEAKGMPFANALLVCVVILKFVAGAMLILHFHADIAAAALLVFVLMATLIFHSFWREQGMERLMHYFAFLSNLSIMGGLTLIIANG